MKIEDSDIIGVSFDLSKTRTGIAIWRNKELVDVTHETFGDTHGPGHLFASFRNRLPDIMVHPDTLTWIGYEDVRPVNKYHSELHFGMLGILWDYAYRNEVHMLGITASEAKKVLTGSGKATKDQMVKAARNAYPVLNIQNDDEADAVAVGLACVNKIQWDSDTPIEEEQVPF